MVRHRRRMMGGGRSGELPPGRVAYRTAVLAVAVAYFVNNTFGKQAREYLWPHGCASVPPTVGHGKVDTTNDSLQAKHGKTKRIYERRDRAGDDNGDSTTTTPPGLLKGLECIFFDDNDGTMYGLNERAQLVSLTDFQDEGSDGGVNVTAKVNVVKDFGFGRPLCGKFAHFAEEAGTTTTLYIADAVLGLTRIKNPKDAKSKLELVASNVATSSDDGAASPIAFADHLSIGPKTGGVYFSDATAVAPTRSGSSGAWDLMLAVTIELIRGKPTGRLLRYDPATSKTEVLSCCYHFANGVAVDNHNEEYVLLAESGVSRIYKHHLTGDLEGKTDVLLDSSDLPGYIDNIECSSDRNNLCYATVAGTVAPIQKLFDALPGALEAVVRNLLLLLPRNLLVMDLAPYAAVLEFDPRTGKMGRLIQDPTGKDIAALTGATLHHDGKLYLGSLSNNYVGVYQLD